MQSCSRSGSLSNTSATTIYMYIYQSQRRSQCSYLQSQRGYILNAAVIWRRYQIFSSAQNMWNAYIWMGRSSQRQKNSTGSYISTSSFWLSHLGRSCTTFSSRRQFLHACTLHACLHVGAVFSIKDYAVFKSQTSSSLQHSIFNASAFISNAAFDSLKLQQITVGSPVILFEWKAIKWSV